MKKSADGGYETGPFCVVATQLEKSQKRARAKYDDGTSERTQLIIFAAALSAAVCCITLSAIL